MIQSLQPMKPIKSDWMYNNSFLCSNAKSNMQPSFRFVQTNDKQKTREMSTGFHHMEYE